jgi:hypothetical protein
MAFAIVFEVPKVKKSSIKNSEPLLAFFIFSVALPSRLYVNKGCVICRKNSRDLRQK